MSVPNSRTASAKASVPEAVVRTWHRTHVIRVPICFSRFSVRKSLL